MRLEVDTAHEPVEVRPVIVQQVAGCGGATAKLKQQ